MFPANKFAATQIKGEKGNNYRDKPELFSQYSERAIVSLGSVRGVLLRDRSDRDKILTDC